MLSVILNQRFDKVSFYWSWMVFCSIWQLNCVFHGNDCISKDDYCHDGPVFKAIFNYTQKSSFIIQRLVWWPWIINRLSYSISQTIIVYIFLSYEKIQTHTHISIHPVPYILLERVNAFWNSMCLWCNPIQCNSF